MSIGDHYTPAELAEKLHVAVGFVQARANANDWPHLRLGPRTVVFTEGHYQEIVTLTERRPSNKKSNRQQSREIRALLAS